MAIRRRGHNAGPRGTLSVLAVASALIAYLLLPVLHAGHHMLEGHSGTTTTLSAAAHAGSGGTCHHTHHHCPSSQTGTSDSLPPGDAPAPHDHGSCDLCKAMNAARKHIDLAPSTGVELPALVENGVAPSAPAEARPESPASPRTSRGPPVLA